MFSQGSNQLILDNIYQSSYNIRIFTESSMTDTQFEMLQTYQGMRVQGLAYTEAIAYIMLMKYEPTDIAWLIKRVYSEKEERKTNTQCG